MPPIPGTQRLGQGIPGGLAGLPGGSSLGPSAHIPGTLSLSGGLPSPMTTTRPTAPGLGQPQQQSAVENGPTITEALAILDRVRQRKLSVGAARKLLIGMPEGSKKSLAQMLMDRHSKEGGQPPLDELKVLVGSSQKGDEQATGAFSQVTDNLLGDIKSTVKGMPAGLGILGKDFGLDAAGLVGGIVGKGSTNHLWEDVGRPSLNAMKWQYGPLATGDVGEFGHRLGEHPLGPILDTLAVVSAGVGASGRAANAAHAVELGRVERIGVPAAVKKSSWPYNLGHLGGGVPGLGGQVVVGKRFYVNPLKNNTFSVRDGTTGQLVGANFPDEATAIKHAQSVSTGGISGDAFERAFKGTIRKGPQGNLITAWERARKIDHEDEIQMIMTDVMDVLDDPNLRVSRRDIRQYAKDSFKEVLADVRTTRVKGQAKPHQLAESLPGFVSPAAGRLIGAGTTGMREVSDLIRAGAIYLRGAYLPNNWVGNEFLNLVQQGVFAPVNLGKSLVMDKHLGTRYTKAIDSSMGQTSAEAVLGQGHGRGYVASMTQPIAHTMGMIADTPFRRAAFLHEARRMGYRKLSDVKDLMDRAAHGPDTAVGEKGLRDVAEIARRASEEIGKFGHMNEAERGMLRHLVFVYSWMRAAGRYSARFPMAHPIQAAIDQYLGQVGTDYNNANLGGVPSFLVGAIPVGRTHDGNPILINPFSLNPLGTGLQEMSMMQGTARVAGAMAKSLVKGKGVKADFNKFVDEDIVNLAPPLLQQYLSTREGTPPDLQGTIAAAKLVRDLKHPGSGSIFPTSRKEALGHFMIGGLFPREADQGAISRSLSREHAGNPAALIPEQLKQFKKTTGQALPDQLIGAYKADLEMIDELKTFQQHYAAKHGSSGFRSLPPANKMEAGLEFVQKYSHLPDEDIAQFKQIAANTKTDAEMNDFANALFSMTGIGTVKRSWDELMRNAHGLGTTRKRP